MRQPRRAPRQSSGSRSAERQHGDNRRRDHSTATVAARVHRDNRLAELQSPDSRLAGAASQRQSSARATVRATIISLASTVRSFSDQPSVTNLFFGIFGKRSIRLANQLRQRLPKRGNGFAVMIRQTGQHSRGHVMRQFSVDHPGHSQIAVQA